MAEALWRLRGGRTRLLTAIGDDADGQYLNNIAPGMLLDGCTIKNGRTPSYAAMLDRSGECLIGLGDMELHNHITPELVNRHIQVFEDAPLIVLDGNAPQGTIDHVLALCKRLNKPVFFEPTDRRKAIKALSSKHVINYASPNFSELQEMARVLKGTQPTKNCGDLAEIVQLSKTVSPYIHFLIITLGSNGVITIKNRNNNIKNMQYKDKIIVKTFPTDPLEIIENVSGAGDSFSSGVIHGILTGLKESQCISIGFKAAKETLMSKNTVSPNLGNINFADLEAANYRHIK